MDEQKAHKTRNMNNKTNKAMEESAGEKQLMNQNDESEYLGLAKANPRETSD